VTFASVAGGMEGGRRCGREVWVGMGMGGMGLGWDLRGEE